MKVDEAVEHLELLYRTVTGRTVPNGPTPYAPIPPEKDPVRHVEEQLDRLLQVLGGPLPQLAPIPWTPRAALLESEREILIQVELPGIPRDGVNVSVLENVLTVSGARPTPLLGKDRPVLRATEIQTGPFARSFTLPQGASGDVSAQLRDGVLELRIPRPTQGRTVGPQAATVVVR
jgi:HSP20 family protein